jgi:S1-C subfamily serine protease
MSYDDWSDAAAPTGRRLVLCLAVLAFAGLGLSSFALLRQHGLVTGERDARRTEVAQLRRQVAALQARDVSLTGRLNRREAGTARLAARVLRSVFTVDAGPRLGSAFAAWRDEDATYLVTANHVVAGETEVTLERKGGSWDGSVQATDPRDDLALIRMEAHPAGADPLWQRPRDAGRPRPGDQLMLVGSPFGLAGTVTTGVVSRVSKRVIQTDAAANPGNSGGPAVDAKGHVVGVLVAGGGENINFAVPILRACVRLRAC